MRRRRRRCQRVGRSGEPAGFRLVGSRWSWRLRLLVCWFLLWRALHYALIHVRLLGKRDCRRLLRVIRLLHRRLLFCPSTRSLCGRNLLYVSGRLRRWRWLASRLRRWCWLAGRLRLSR